MKTISKLFGMDYKMVTDKIKLSPITSKNSINLGTQLNGLIVLESQTYLHLKQAHGFFFIHIQIEDIKPELRKTLLDFKRECFQTVAETPFPDGSIASLLSQLIHPQSNN